MVIFLEVGLVVFKGVVIFGYCFMIIKLRILWFIYGIDVCLNFDLIIYKEDKKIKVDGIDRCNDCFFFIVIVGIEIDIGEEKIESYEIILKY